MSKSTHGSFLYPVGHVTSNHMLLALPPASIAALTFCFIFGNSDFGSATCSSLFESLTYYQQKEPKLSRARQIPEWSQYDAEIARFARQLVKDGKIGSSALGAEVDALAGDKSTTCAEGVAAEQTIVGEVPAQAPHEEL
jgi:hypothetical protein